MSNRKIAEWLGWKWIESKSKQMPFDPYWQYPNGLFVPAGKSNFSTDEAAITLLPLLIEKGYRTDLYDTQDYGNGKYWAFGIKGVGIERILAKEQTISAAISTALLKLIEAKPCE